MARMSDFHVVGDPRYAPDAPSGGGGVSKEYVDNADINVKKTAAKGHNSKYDETVIPSQYTNKLYVYGNPESMYPASDIGGEIPAITGGHASVDYNWWGQQVSNWQQNDYKTYGYDSETDKIFDKLCVVKCISQDDTRNAYYTILCTCDDQYITVNPNRTEPYLSLKDSHVAQKLYNQAYSGDPPTPQGYNLVTDVGYYAGNVIADFNYKDNQYYGFEVSGIPLFVVNSNTQSEFDNINHYIATGDYSRAINYSELYPDNPESFVSIDVISGDWYTVVNNTWVKQGTLDLNETCGTEVEANPQGTPTDTLNSIGIDGVIYGIEGGGSGGGSFEKELLYSDDYNTSRPSSITLSKSYEGYDYLEFELWKWDDGNYYDIIGSYFASKELLDSVKDGFKTGRRNVFLIYAWQNSNQYIRFTIDSITQFTNINSNGNFSISKIYGVKLGSGSGGGGSTLPFEFVIDPNDNGINIVYDDSILNGGE